MEGRFVNKSDKGTYILILRASRTSEIQVGKLGRFKFRDGTYAYVGSAFGPGGLKARIQHHLKPIRSPHWHIDYLRTDAAPVQIWGSAYPRKLEHRWSAVLAQSRQTTIPVSGFGSSDCRCQTHLFRLSGPHCLARFKNLIFPKLTRSATVRMYADFQRGRCMSS